MKCTLFLLSLNSMPVTKVKPVKKTAAPIKRDEAIALALAQIEKQYGEGAVIKLGEAQKIHVETFPSGSPSLDIALGGGMPKGRIIEIFGPESSGKTTLALHAIAEVQKAGGQAAFIDAEHALDVQYAKKIGVNIDQLLVSQPDHGEQALEIAETLVRSCGVDVIVIDSVAALTPKAELEGAMGEPQMGLQARLMSQALRKLTAIVAKSRCTVIFINQIRMKIGVMFGNPETTPGGNALKFYASVRIDIRRISRITEAGPSGEEVTGNRTRVKVVKNKVAPPFRVAEFDILYNQGISREGDLIDLGLKYGLITKSGVFLSYGDAKLGQGREKARLYLRGDAKVADNLEKEIREKAAETV
jgi:recombination protein RecA